MSPAPAGLFILWYTHGMKDVNRELLSKKYRDTWVALESKTGRIVASAKTAKGAYEQSQKKGIKEPVLTRIPKNYGSAYILITV